MADKIFEWVGLACIVAITISLCWFVFSIGGAIKRMDQ